MKDVSAATVLHCPAVCQARVCRRSLEQVSQLLLQVLGVLHTGGQAERCINTTACWGNTRVRVVLCTYFFWMASCLHRHTDRQTPDRQTDGEIIGLQQKELCSVSTWYHTRTYWYCRCVVMMDIFLRLWKTEEVTVVSSRTVGADETFRTD